LGEIVVSAAGQSFVPVLAELLGRSFDEPWPLASIENLLEPAGCWALLGECAKGDVLCPAGFVLARVASDEAEVLSLGVVPEFRRLGVARALMLALMRQATTREASKIFLEVGADNFAAEKLYRNLGFFEVGRRKNYYLRANRELVDALIMRFML
jgi:ribosomal-protein-alanine N-acetyltransferase